MGKKDKKRNLIRQGIIMKGYATISDIREFIPCSYEKALQILATEEVLAQKEGKSTLKGISAKRLTKYIDLTLTEIHEYAIEEKKELSSM